MFKSTPSMQRETPSAASFIETIKFKSTPSMQRETPGHIQLPKVLLD